MQQLRPLVLVFRDVPDGIVVKGKRHRRFIGGVYGRMTQRTLGLGFKVGVQKAFWR